MKNCLNIAIGILLIFLIMTLGIKYLMPIVFGGVSILITFNLPVILEGFRKTRSLLSNFKMIHLSYFFLFIAVLIWRLRSSHSFYTDPLDQAAQYKIICMGIAGVLAFISLISNIGKSKSEIPLVPSLILIYAILALPSTMIGGNAYYGIYKAVELLIVTIFLFAVISQMNSLEDAKKLGNILLLFYFILLVMEVVSAVIKPDAGFYVYGKGVIGRILSGSFPLMDPNGIGFISAVLAVASFCRLLNAKNRRDIQLYVLILMFSLSTLILAQARTSIFGTIAAMVIVLILSQRWKKIALFVLTISALIMFSDYFIAYIMRGQDIGMFEKFSGRMVMWEHVWSKFLQHPILGYGFVSAGFLMKIYAPGQTAPVFNSYLECLLNSGIVGFVPWVMAIIATFVLLLRGTMRAKVNNLQILRSFSIEKVGLMVILIARSMTTSMLTIHSIEFTLFLTLIVAAQATLLSSKNKSDG